MHTLVKLIVICCLPLTAVSCQAQSQLPSSFATSADFSRAELDQMLAPIALYPDTVLSHVLIAATYPLEVVQADRWARAHSALSPEAAVDAAEAEPWDPSVQALVAFPQVLERMSKDLQWTQRLGDAFLMDEARVMDAIQQLRQKAYAAGSLQGLEHVTVQREKKVIIIEPAVERVVYIPYYDSRVVYGNWWWDDYPPLYWHHPRPHLHVGGFYWGPRAYLGSSFFFTSFHWQQRRVVHVEHRHHHPRLYSGRSIARYDGARHWRHNPVHRRGVEYRSPRLREHYSDRRTSVHRFQDTSERRAAFTRKQVGLDHPRAQEQTRRERAAAVRQRLNDAPGRDWRQPPAGAPRAQRQEAQIQRKLDGKRESSPAVVDRQNRAQAQASRAERLEKRRAPQSAAPSSDARVQEQPRRRFERSETRDRRQQEAQSSRREQLRQSSSRQLEQRSNRVSDAATERRSQRVSDRATDSGATDRGHRWQRPER